MHALICPQCGAPLKHGENECPYCSAGLVDDSDKIPKKQRVNSNHSIPIPEGWINHLDYWHGFSIAHPLGWSVETYQGSISVRKDPLGITSAWIWPFNLPSPMNAHQVAENFVRMSKAGNPTFQAWIQQNLSPESNRISLRTSATKYGCQLKGTWNILVLGNTANISGFWAPSQSIAELSQILSTILATFEIQEMMDRQSAFDPSENAFSVQLPASWSFSGGINRNTIGGTGMPFFTISDTPSGLVAACMPNYSWFYMDPFMGGIMGMMGGYPSLKYMGAAQYCQQVLLPSLVKNQPSLELISITDRPDIAEVSLAELCKQGYPPGYFEASSALLFTRYVENGQRYLQKTRMFIQRQNSAGNIFTAPTPGWMALLDTYYRAPEQRFTALEPILCGVLESYKINPAWQAAENQRNNNIIVMQQQDRSRRLAQISQTLSETSDIITSGYWGRQASFNRMSEMRSNAILGVQNVAATDGDVYKVPYGYDRYWKDGLGNFYGGDWLTQPDINWTPLDPTGI